MTRSVDFPAAARAVCTEIWGRPTAKYATHWRFGNRQSKSLHLESGRIVDFETDWKGGVLDVLQQYGGCADRAAAWHWLEARGLAPPRDPDASKPTPAHRTGTADGTRPGREHRPAPPPFHETDLPRLDYRTIPDDPEHPLNLWAATKCSRPDGAPWPDSCRWLRGPMDPQDPELRFLHGHSLMAPLATPGTWLECEALPRSAVRGIHVVHVARDGSPRRHRDLNKRSWNNGRHGTLAGCCFMAGRPQTDGRLAMVEGLADALALHWHLGLPVAAAGGSLAGLIPAAGDLALLAGWPLHVQLEIWPDQDAKANPQTGLRAGPAGALALQYALRGVGVPDERITIMRFGHPGQDPCDWIAETHRHTHTPGRNPS